MFSEAIYKNKRLESILLSHVGTAHEKQNCACQDKGVICTDEKHHTVVLCDGVGSAAYGGMAAQLTADEVARIVHDNFYQYLYEDTGTIKREIIQVIERKLSKYAEENKIEKKELACTILAVSMDKDGKFISIHLGDGKILRKSSNSNYMQSVSSPEKGFFSNYTYTTMNCSLYEHIRFYRWLEPDTEGIVMYTDGIVETDTPILSRMGEVTKWPISKRDFYEVIEKNHNEDDYSGALLMKNVDNMECESGM